MAQDVPGKSGQEQRRAAEHDGGAVIDAGGDGEVETGGGGE